MESTVHIKNSARDKKIQNLDQRLKCLKMVQMLKFISSRCALASPVGLSLGRVFYLSYNYILLFHIIGRFQ